MRVIVFGGTGWVGHHIVRCFADAGYDVTICSRGKKTTFAEDISADIPHVQADKSSPDDMKRVFREGYEVVVDSVPSEISIQNIAKYASSLTRYIHCSSTGGYAPLQIIPADETHPYSDFMGGWKQKAVVDRLVMDLFHRDGFPATVLRPSYITGPGMLPLDNLGGRREDFLSDILEDRPLDLPGDGLALLQPIHVLDLARAFVLTVQQPRAVGQIYNLCLEKAVTIRRYIMLNGEALGRTPIVRQKRVDDMLESYGDAVHAVGLHFLATHMCYDISKAKDQLGYCPQMTTEEAVKETARWAASRLHGSTAAT